MSISTSAQGLYKLSDEQIDEPINEFLTLPENFKDSVYTMRILYPDYTPLSRKIARKYRKKIGSVELPESPVIDYCTFVDKDGASLRASFSPLVERDGKLYLLTDYEKQWYSVADTVGVESKENNSRGITRSADITTASSVYASSSRLVSGTWAKIRVSETGICRLSSDVISQAGFSDISKIKIYGFGGALIPEQLTEEWISAHDDLPQVTVCPKDGQLYFYAYGPVSFDSNTVTTRTRNPYSDYGYYFITQNDDARSECSEQDLLNTAATNAVAYHDLYEKDEYAWVEMGRELVESETIENSSKTVTLSLPDNPGNITITAVISSGTTAANYTISAGGVSKSGTVAVSGDDMAGMFRTVTLQCTGSGSLPVTINCSGGPVRIDYVLATFDNPKSYASLSTSYQAAEYVENVTNQNHHADASVDYVIIIPTSGKLYNQALRLGELHSTNEGMTYRIVPANELYNEFSSGTPDVSAYRRYLKMFYDRNNSSCVKNVLLFGDSMWDNRMKTTASQYTTDDYLLVYETYNSYDRTKSTPIDDFITILQDGMTVHGDGIFQKSMQMDCGVGRIPVITDTEAKLVVDKIIDYVEKSSAGAWQNGVTFIGDDGDENSHMKFINTLADDLIAKGGYNVTKIMADAYVIKKTATGNTYPDVEKLIKKQQNDGQLIMNYGGHGSWTQLSHEKLLTLDEVKKFKGDNYSFWIMAACETMPFDYLRTTLGEQLLLNGNGGAIAAYGAARSVYETYNARIDKYMMKYLLDYDTNGKPYTLGEAQRLAKNQLIKDGQDMTVNKHHYALLGDPAMTLALPTYKVKVDKVNGTTTDQNIQIKALSKVTVEGHIETLGGETATTFNGTLNSVVKDTKQTITCRGQASDSETLFQYTDYDSNIFAGTTTVSGGQFNFTFRVPKDIYDDNTANGLMVLYAYDENNKVSANGTDTSIYPNGYEESVNDSIGPSIYSYLNTPSFVNGGNVGRTPFFVAEINDADGINVAESSLGHYMELIVDGDASMTYDLNDNFTFDADSYTSGTTWYVLPNLSVGKHSLTFRAWDVLNNSSQVSLDFNVVKGFEPTIADVWVTPNPARVGESVTFYVTHDLQGSEADVNIDIIDLTGRVVGQLQWSDTFSATKSTTSYKWPVSGVSQGMYLYRVRLSCDNSKYVSKTKKLLIGY